MNAFVMQAEYIDSETGEWVTENVLIDDMEVRPAEPSQPEPNNNDECPW